MPKASFYTHVQQPAAFVGRLAARALQNGGSVLVWADDEAALLRLDMDLWRYEAASFLVHEVWQEGEAYPEHVPVVLGAGIDLPQVAANVVVLNVSAQFWCNAPTQPLRVLEIVSDHLEALAEARERFKAYRNGGFEVEHFNMQGKA